MSPGPWLVKGAKGSLMQTSSLLIFWRARRWGGHSPQDLPTAQESPQAGASLEDASCTSPEVAPTLFLRIIHVHTKKGSVASLSLWQPVPLPGASCRLTAPQWARQGKQSGYGPCDHEPYVCTVPGDACHGGAKAGSS